MALDDDVAAAVQRMRAKRNVGLSEAVNERSRGIPSQGTRFIQRTFPMGARIDVADVSDTLEYLEGLN